MIWGLSRSLVIFLLCTACQSAMSAEEAKKVSASFITAPFVPPPRTINDLTAILDQETVANPKAQAAAEERLKALPPDSKDPKALSDFFYRRGVLGHNWGKSRQAVDDLSQALAYAKQAGAPQYRILAYLGFSEDNVGSDIRTREYYRAAIKAVPYDDRVWLFRLYNNLIWVSARAGDFKEAESVARELDLLLGESRRWKNVSSRDLNWRKALAHNSRAAIYEWRGEAAKAEELYRVAASELAQDPRNANSSMFDLVHARVGRTLVAQGRLLEAEQETRRGLLGSLRRQGRYSYQTATLLDYLTYVIFTQGRYADAEKLARAAVQIRETLGLSPGSLPVTNSRGWVASALRAQGRSAEALVEFDKIRLALANEPEVLQTHFVRNLNWPFALLGVGRAQEAVTMLTASLAWSQRVLGNDHSFTADTRGGLGIAYQIQGDGERALIELRQSVRMLYGQAGASETEPDADVQRTPRGLRQYILTWYMWALAESRGTPLEKQLGGDVVAETFRLADIARGQVVQGALTAAAARASAKDPRLADLIRREQDARTQVIALYGALANAMSAPTSQQDAAAVASLRQDVAALQRARRALADRIKRDFSGYARLISPAPATIAEIRAVLRPGEALINTYVAPGATYIWAVPVSGPVSFAVVPMGEARLASAVAKLRASLDVSAGTLGDIPPFDVAAAHDLYRQLFEPVKAGWAGAQSLLVVPHGPLTQLPFALLPTAPVPLRPDTGPLFANYRAVPWLIRTHAVTVLPSATSLVTLRALPPGDPARLAFAGFGDPYFSVEQARRAAADSVVPAPESVVAPAVRAHPITLRDLKISKADSVSLALLPRLPETAEEIRSIAVALNADLTRDVFLGVRATEKAVKTTDLSRYRVIAFATHGLVPGDLDGLAQPALALTAPEVGDTDGDGLLTMEEILALRLNADWVVLSACNTASGQGAGAEAISGLGRAFFYAGARALLVSNWPVETTSARTLTTDLFRRQAADPRLTRAQALQQTLNALIDGGEYLDPQTKQTVFSYAHPIFWAPFTLVGDGGAGGATR
jgi:CHAT domain-containing protein